MILTVLWVHAALWALLAIAQNLVTVGIALSLFTVTMPWFGIAAYDYQLRVSPDDLRSRVGTSFNLLLWAAAPLAGGIAGLLLDLTEPAVAALTFGGWVLILAATATATRRLQAIES